MGVSSDLNTTFEKVSNNKLRSWNAQLDAKMVTKIQRNLGREKLRSALEHAVAACDDVLDKIHRDLKPHWKEEFIKGLRLRLSYLDSTSGEHQDEVKGDALLDKFRDWLKANTRSNP